MCVSYDIRIIRKLEDDRTRGGPTCRWENNIKIYLLEIPLTAWNIGSHFLRVSVIAALY